MTKVQKLEREKKRWQYLPIVSTVLIMIITGILLIPVIGSLPMQENIIKIIILIILLSIIMGIYYMVQKDICKNMIEIYNYNIEDELLKPEIKQQFHLSKEEYVEIFWNDETDTEEFSKEKMHKKYGAKFYAKLVSDDEIEVVVKDEEGELMDKPKKITRFKYLREHYKTKP